MELEEYEIMYRVEDSHWWYLGMRTITLAILDSVVGRHRSLDVLDAGCGTGAVMQYLAEFGAVTGLDCSTEALTFCHQRGVDRLVQASIVEMPFHDQSFDLMTSFDVLSEVEPTDQAAAMAELFRVLRPGGHVLLRLPAYEWLRAKHDERVHTRHRFTRGELRGLIRAAGLDIVVMSYANTLLFPLVAGKRLSEKILPGNQSRSDLTISTGMTNALFRGLLRVEAPIIRRVGLPFGVTVVALARRPGARPEGREA